MPAITDLTGPTQREGSRLNLRRPSSPPVPPARRSSDRRCTLFSSAPTTSFWWSTEKRPRTDCNPPGPDRQEIEPPDDALYIPVPRSRPQAGVLMAKAPAFQFYASDWRSDGTVSLMSLEEEGAYIRLLAFAWLEGSIPVDAATRARVLRVSKRKADALWASVLADLFVTNDAGDGLVNPRQEEQRKRYEELRKKKAKAGQASAQARADAQQEGNTRSTPVADVLEQNGNPSMKPEAGSHKTEAEWRLDSPDLPSIDSALSHNTPSYANGPKEER